jgi:multidrug efflux system outer membrane protein
VLQAEQQLFPAQLTLAQDRAQVYGAAVSVYQSLGGGWVTLADDMTTSSAVPRTTTVAPAAAQVSAQ